MATVKSFHGESYTTVRVTSYRDSTLISTPNNLYLLWLPCKQELRVSSYNRRITALPTSTFPRARDARNPLTTDTYSHTQEDSPSIKCIYIWLWLSSRLARRSLHPSAAPASGAITVGVRKAPADGYRKWVGYCTGHGWL